MVPSMTEKSPKESGWGKVCFVTANKMTIAKKSRLATQIRFLVQKINDDKGEHQRPE